jgi:hypothetical protein
MRERRGAIARGKADLGDAERFGVLASRARGSYPRSDARF